MRGAEREVLLAGSRRSLGRLGSGPDVVFSHGTPWSSELWHPSTAALVPDFTVHLWDMPATGCPRSTDVVALAPWGSDYFRLVPEHPDVFGALPSHVHAGALRADVAGASHVGLSPAAMESLVSPWLDAEGQAAFYRQIAQADQAYTDEIEPLSPTLDLPVHVIWGRQDTWIPVKRAHCLSELIPRATLRVVEDAGHLIQLDQPTALAMTVTRWLTSRH